MRYRQCNSPCFRKSIFSIKTHSTYPHHQIQVALLTVLQTQKATQLSESLKTVYLFTKNDFLTFAVPTALFATFGALSGPILTTNSSPNALSILLRLPLALLIVWANLLVFDISNQRHPSAVEEDAINKPHRPLPSGRISIDASRRLLLAGVPLVLALSWALGCWEETLLLYCFTWMYNDLGGCDENCVLRNLLIAIGYGLYSSAALRVMTGSEYAVNGMGFAWVGVITFVMFVTQHICDIKDMEGDKARGRHSIPIVLGDEKARWSVAVPIVVCSVLCPLFFRLSALSYISTLSVGLVVASRTLLYRDLKSDKLTWKLWAFWTVWLFALPLVKDPGCFIALYETARNVVCPGEDCAGSLNLVAVSGVALVVEGRRLYGQCVVNGTVPQVERI